MTPRRRDLLRGAGIATVTLALAGLVLAARLVRDAGFEPVLVGPLARSRDFDVGTAVFGRGLTSRELRRGLGLGP